MKNINIYFNCFTTKEKLNCFLIFSSGFFGALLETVGISAIFPLISLVGDPNFINRYPQIVYIMEAFGIADQASLVIVCSCLLIGLYLLKNIYIALQIKYQINFITNLRNKYVSGLFAIYLLQPYAYHLERNSAVLLRNINSSGDAIFSNLLLAVFFLINELLTACMIIGMLLWMDFWITVCVFMIMGLLVLVITKYFHKKIVREAYLQKESNAAFIKWVNQGLGAIKETKIMGREKFFSDQFYKAYAINGTANGKYRFWNQLPRLIIETAVVTMLLLIIIGKVYSGESLENIVPSFAVLGLAAFRLMPSANRIIGYYDSIKFQQPLFEELYSDLLEVRAHVMGMGKYVFSSTSHAMEFQHEICIDDVHFRYSEHGDEILRGVSFKIQKGDFVGIVGPSGAGKTTFVDVLLGLFRPDRGSVQVDGHDIFDDIRGWQINLAYVPQNIYLIDGTIKENIALGESDVTIDTDWVKKTLQMADLYDFVATLPQQLETCVGEQGVKLSGGQRQRIGIARALYRRPNILVLDEATSALDHETEKSIMDTILKLKGKMTIISIAHRLSTLDNCDYKVEFVNGTVRII